MLDDGWKAESSLTKDRYIVRDGVRLPLVEGPRPATPGTVLDWDSMRRDRIGAVRSVLLTALAGIAVLIVAGGILAGGEDATEKVQGVVGPSDVRVGPSSATRASGRAVPSDRLHSEDERGHADQPGDGTHAAPGEWGPPSR